LGRVVELGRLVVAPDRPGNGVGTRLLLLQVSAGPGRGRPANGRRPVCRLSSFWRGGQIMNTHLARQAASLERAPRLHRRFRGRSAEL
jgi:hypothetical protein